jgi:hypothetical protein
LRTHFSPFFTVIRGHKSLYQTPERGGHRQIAFSMPRPAPTFRHPERPPIILPPCASTHRPHAVDRMPNRQVELWLLWVTIEFYCIFGRCFDAVTHQGHVIQPVIPKCLHSASLVLLSNR